VKGHHREQPRSLVSGSDKAASATLTPIYRRATAFGLAAALVSAFAARAHADGDQKHGLTFSKREVAWA